MTTTTKKKLTKKAAREMLREADAIKARWEAGHGVGEGEAARYSELRAAALGVLFPADPAAVEIDSLYR